MTAPGRPSTMLERGRREELGRMAPNIFAADCPNRVVKVVGLFVATAGVLSTLVVASLSGVRVWGETQARVTAVETLARENREDLKTLRDKIEELQKGQATLNEGVRGVQRGQEQFRRDVDGKLDVILRALQSR